MILQPSQNKDVGSGWEYDVSYSSDTKHLKTWLVTLRILQVKIQE